MRPKNEWNPHQREVDRWLEAFGHPERGKRVIHIVGTNGKGSTGRTIALALEKVLQVPLGHFVSPHVHRYEERILIGSRPIDSEILLAIQKEMDEKQKSLHLTPLPYFIHSFVEAMIAMRDLPVIVMEAGIGGREDVTNIVPTVMNVVTTIDYDHRNVLGNTLESIAANKAGIMMPGIPTVSTNQQEVAERVLRGNAKKTQSPLVFFTPDQIQKARFDWPEGQRPCLQFHYAGGMLSGEYTARMIGWHQFQNFGTALLALETLFDPSVASPIGLFPTQLSEETLRTAAREAVAEAYLPGRLECLSLDPPIFIDGAHNEQAVTMLLRNLQALQDLAPACHRERVLLFGAHDGKLTAEQEEAFTGSFDAVYRVEIEGKSDADVVRQMAEQMDRAISEHPEALFVAAGSLYILDGVSRWVQKAQYRR